MSKAPPILQVDQLTRTFGGYAAVSGLSFVVNEGEILGLVGPNGAGKTTTFNVVTGFLKATSGTVRFRGEQVSGAAPHVLARRGMVRTFQHTRVFDSLSVLQNVLVASHLVSKEFGGGPANRTSLEGHALAVLEEVGLLQRQDDAADGLAYGELRVLEIALALAAKPKLLMLDEPFAGMNDTEANQTMALVHRIRATGVTVMVIDHHMQTMARGCDRLVVMDYGIKLAEGFPDQVTNQPQVIQAYLGAGDDLPAPAPAAGASESVLEMRDVSVKYGHVRALDKLNLRVGRGEIVALVGSNGAGKTSSLRAVSGLLPLAGGSVQLFGHDAARTGPVGRVRSGLAHCPEGREIFPRMTVLENLELGASASGGPPPGTLDHIYELFPRLQERSGQLAGSLSGGEQQMLAIGRALMSGPRLLLLDEPTLGLSPLLAREVAEALLRLNGEGLSVLLVEQNAVLALAIAHRAYVLENGVVAMQGAADEMRQDPAVARVYLGH